MQRHTYICARHREVHRTATICPVCREPLRYMGYRWRAPKKRDDRSWSRIERGEIMWDRRAAAESTARAQRFADAMRRYAPRRATWMRGLS